MIDRVRMEETNIEAINRKITILLSSYVCKLTMKVQIYENISSLLVQTRCYSSNDGAT